MNSRILRFPQLFLFALFVLAFSAHAYFVINDGKSLSENLLWQAYLFNLIVAEIILTVMLRIAKKQKDYLGFIFMGGSGLKFLVFFLVFYPAYKEDGEMSIAEFASFFIPYILALSFKSFILLKTLNQD